MKKRIVFVRSNPLSVDTRIAKEIKALEQDFNSIFLGWERGDCKTAENRNIDYRFLNFKAPYGKKALLFIPIWWIFEFLFLLKADWDILHIVNFDSLFPGLVAAKIKGKPIVYELLDTYEDSIRLPSFFRNILVNVDRQCMRFVDKIILADEFQNQEFGVIPNRNVFVIYDSPPDLFKESQIRENPLKIFTLFYAGVLFEERHLNIDKIIEAVKDIDDVQLIIAGYGDLVPYVKKKSEEIPNKLKFIGRITYVEAIQRAAEASLMFQLRSSDVLINRYICGSTLLNAMMVGIPMISNKETATAEKIIKESCGLIVDVNDLEQIKNAIITMRDNPNLCKQYGSNARKAYEKYYSWELMEKRLLEIYNMIISK